jgi:hypothetical protein
VSVGSVESEKHNSELNVPLLVHKLPVPSLAAEVSQEPIYKKSPRKVKLKKSRRKIKSSLMMVKGVKVTDEIKNTEKPRFFQN